MTRRSCASQGSTSAKLRSKVSIPPWRATNGGPSGSPCSSNQMGTPSISCWVMFLETSAGTANHRPCLAKAREQIRFRDRGVGGVVRSDEGLLTEDRSERLGRQVAPERLFDLAGVGHQRAPLAFDDGADVDHG